MCVSVVLSGASAAHYTATTWCQCKARYDY